MRRKLDPSLTLAALLLCHAQVSCGQPARPRVAKGEALKSVKVAALEGWKEAVSDTGRFRVLFHGEPVASKDPEGAKGFEMKGFRVKSFALYYDYQLENNDDNATVWKKYNESVEALAKKGSILLAKRDLTLNGRPGVEFILLGPGGGGGGEWAKSYMRSFMVGSRLYTLAVDDYINVSEAAEVPAEVQNFFDSFTFWE